MYNSLEAKNRQPSLSMKRCMAAAVQTSECFALTDRPVREIRRRQQASPSDSKYVRDDEHQTPLVMMVEVWAACTTDRDPWPANLAVLSAPSKWSKLTRSRGPSRTDSLPELGDPAYAIFVPVTNTVLNRQAPSGNVCVSVPATIAVQTVLVLMMAPLSWSGKSKLPE